jgi:hypothetical protein
VGVGPLRYATEAQEKDNTTAICWVSVPLLFFYWLPAHPLVLVLRYLSVGGVFLSAH